MSGACRSGQWPQQRSEPPRQANALLTLAFRSRQGSALPGDPLRSTAGYVSKALEQPARRPPATLARHSSVPNKHRSGLARFQLACPRHRDAPVRSALVIRVAGLVISGLPNALRSHATPEFSSLRCAQLAARLRSLGSSESSQVSRSAIRSSCKTAPATQPRCCGTGLLSARPRRPAIDALLTTSLTACVRN